MPAVSSTKQETKVSAPELQDPMKYVLQVTDKKVRNLEKRKCKLDQVREKAKSGAILEKDQKIALDKYDEVVSSLESVHELQKTFLSFNSEVEKQGKKNAKREKAEQQAHERKRFQKWLQYRGLLDALGDDEVRADFQSGKYGAVVLTEDNLKQFDDLYNMIEPCRVTTTDEDYEEKMVAASEHIVCLLDGRDREVVGTTYKELMELLDLINKCGYFETRQNCQIEAEQEVEAVVEAEVEQELEVEESEPIEEPQVPTPAAPISVPAPSPTATPVPVQQRLEPEPCPAPLEPTAPAMGAMPQPTPNPTPATASSQPRPTHHQPFLETPYNPHARPRPLQEIVSSVQGNFLFLQDSELDAEGLHSDPAVVMAQPMVTPSPTMPSSLPTSMPNSQPAEPTAHPSQTFSGPSFGDAAPSMEAEPAPALPDRGQQLLGSVPPPGVPPPQSRLDFPPPQGFGQHPAGDSLFPEESSQMSGSMMPPSVADGPQSQFNLASSMNMSMSQPPVQDNSGDKKFTMNVSAPVFQSMYSQVPRGGASADMEPADQGTGDAPSPADYSQGGFQGNGFQNTGFQTSQRGGNRGNYRGNRGRSNNMPNGYANNRGGQGGRGGRTGGGFNQGSFTPRSDFRADSYQSYSNSGFANQGNPANFPKRGGSGNGNGQNRGGPRGGNGAPRNSNNRGAPRGNYGRPAAAAFN